VRCKRRERELNFMSYSFRYVEGIRFIWRQAWLEGSPGLRREPVDTVQSKFRVSLKACNCYPRAPGITSNLR